MVLLLKDFTPDRENLILGLMSGTSCDGLDVALVGLKENQGKPEFRFLKGKSFLYDHRLRSYLKELPRMNKNTVYAVSQANFYLAEVWAEKVNAFLKENELSPEDVTLIASHGHTIWHQSTLEKYIDRPVRSTLQIGDPGVLAKLTQISVVGDFRVGDMAVGGQGAPLIPYFDFVYFSRFKKKVLAINLGGIANFTLIPSDGDLQKVVGFDTGPGNMLLDLAVNDHFKASFDKGGQIAFGGKLSNELLDYLLEIDSFVNLPPPKSTGREHYGAEFYEKIKQFSQKHKIKPEDIVHTLGFYTVMAIHTNFATFVKPKFGWPDMVVVSGGGALNDFLMEQIRIQFSDIPVRDAQDLGINSEFKEAIGFAILGWNTLLGRPSNVPSVTGAKKTTVLGKICLP